MNLWEASTLNPQPSTARARPWVVVNMAMSADGKIATARRTIASFGSRRDLDHLYDLRATADAVMCGARTVEGENVDLGPGPDRYQRRRLRRGLATSHLRVLVSGSATLDPHAHVFARRFSPILVLVTARAARKRVERLTQVADQVVLAGDAHVDFAKVLAWLRREWNVRRLVVEGGGELNAALFSARLVDEIHLTLCPFLFGGHRAPTLAEGVGAASLADATAFDLRSVRRAGDELFCVLTARSAGHADEPRS